MLKLRSMVDHNSRILEFTLDKCVLKLLRDFAVKEFFSYESLHTRKEEKLSTDELLPRGVQDSPLSYFRPTSRSSQESEGFFFPTSYIQGQVRETQGSR